MPEFNKSNAAAQMEAAMAINGVTSFCDSNSDDAEPKLRTVNLPPRVQSKRFNNTHANIIATDDDHASIDYLPPRAITIRPDAAKENDEDALPSLVVSSSSSLSEHSSNKLATSIKDIEKEDDVKDMFERCRSDMSRALQDREPFDEVKSDSITTMDKVEEDVEEEGEVASNKTPEEQVEMVTTVDNKEVTVVSATGKELGCNNTAAVSTKEETNTSLKKKEPRGFDLLKKKARLSRLRRKKNETINTKPVVSTTTSSTNEDSASSDNKSEKTSKTTKVLSLRQRMRMFGNRQSKRNVTAVKQHTSPAATYAESKRTKDKAEATKQDEVPSTPTKKKPSTEHEESHVTPSALATIIIETSPDGLKKEDEANPADTPTTTTTNASFLEELSPSKFDVECPSGFTPSSNEKSQDGIVVESEVLNTTATSTDEKLLPPAMPTIVVAAKKEEAEDAEDVQKKESEPQELEVDTGSEAKESENSIQTSCCQSILSDVSGRIIVSDDDHGVIDTSTEVVVDVTSTLDRLGDDDIEVIKCMGLEDIDNDILMESSRANSRKEQEVEDEDVFDGLSSKDSAKVDDPYASKESTKVRGSGRVLGRILKPRTSGKGMFSSKDKQSSIISDKGLSNEAREAVKIASYASVDSSNEEMNPIIITPVTVKSVGTRRKKKKKYGLSQEAQATIAIDMGLDTVNEGTANKGLSNKAKYVLGDVEAPDEMDEIEVEQSTHKSQNRIIVSKKQKFPTGLPDKSSGTFDLSCVESYETQDSSYNESEGLLTFDSEEDDYSFVSKTSEVTDEAFNFEPCGIQQEELVDDLIDAFDDIVSNWEITKALERRRAAANRRKYADRNKRKGGGERRRRSSRRSSSQQQSRRSSSRRMEV